MQVVVKNGNVERAMRTLKKKIQKEGLLRELKQKQYFEKLKEIVDQDPN